MRFPRMDPNPRELAELAELAERAHRVARSGSSEGPALLRELDAKRAAVFKSVTPCGKVWRRAPRTFRPGWGRRATIPGMLRRGARGTHQGEGAQRLSVSYQRREEALRMTGEALRRAGFWIRHTWSVDPIGRLLDGPYRGAPVIDPWRVLLAVRACQLRWAVRPTDGPTGMDVSVSGRRCRKGHVCPHCASVDSARRGAIAEVLAELEDEIHEGVWVLATLTHADLPPLDETLSGAWRRFEGAYQRIRTGPNGQTFRRLFRCGVVALETTGGSTGWTWHPHTHLVLRLQDGTSEEEARAWLAQAWHRATERAWRDELGDTCGPFRAWNRAAAGDGWWKRLRPEEKHTAIREAVKYGVTSAAVHGASRMAEWLQWSHGRRLVRWLGTWSERRLRVAAEEISAARRRALELQRQETGDAAPVGLPLVGVRCAETMNPGRGGRLRFERGPPRTCAAVRTVRRWWKVRATLEHRLQRHLSTVATSERASAEIALREKMREWLTQWACSPDAAPERWAPWDDAVATRGGHG